jgi:hypothetical protein
MLASLAPTCPTFDLAIGRASGVLQLRQAFVRLQPASRSQDARRAQIALALSIVEEFLRPPANRAEHDLMRNVAIVLETDARINYLAACVDQHLFDQQGRAMDPPEQEPCDIVVEQVGIGVFEKLTPLVVQVLHHFSPSY